MHTKESSIRPPIDRTVISSAGERLFRTFTDIACSSNTLTVWRAGRKDCYHKCMLTSGNLDVFFNDSIK